MPLRIVLATGFAHAVSLLTQHPKKTRITIDIGMGSERKVSPWLVGAVCLVVGLGGGGMGMWVVRRQSGLPTEELERLTVEAERSPLTLKIRVNGSVVPVRSVNLSPKNAGRLVDVFVQQGDVVKVGEPIAQMENRDLSAQMLQAQARKDQAEARLAELKAGDTAVVIQQGEEEIEQAQAQLRVEDELIQEAEAQVAEAKAQIVEAKSQRFLADRRLQRNQALALEGAIAQDRLDEVTATAFNATAALERTEAGLARVEAGLERAKANRQQAQSRVDLAKLRLKDQKDGARPEQLAQTQAQVKETIGQMQAIEIQVEDSLLRAPFAGIITQRFADPGAFVTPTTSASSTASATSTSVVAIAQGLEVLANVPEVDIDAVQLGQVVEVTADAFPGQTFLAQVRLVSPEAVEEQNVTSFQVRVALNTGQEQLRSGMNVDLTFIGESLGNALVVPTVAIVTREGERGVLIPDNKNEPEFQPVKTGVSIGNETQILSGIEVGERVFIDLPSDRRFQEEE